MKWLFFFFFTYNDEINRLILALLICGFEMIMHRMSFQIYNITSVIDEQNLKSSNHQYGKIYISICSSIK